MNAENPILFYEREYYMFSNFSAFQVTYNGSTWMTSEHAYQAAKFTDPIIQTIIQEAPSPHDAYQRTYEQSEHFRSDWQEVKIDIMTNILRTKLNQHTIIQQKLLETGERRIIEDSPTDAFWGWGADKQGRNELGKIWMRLREELMKKRRNV